MSRTVIQGQYHLFQTELSRTIPSDSVKYSGLFKRQQYCYKAYFSVASYTKCMSIFVYLSCDIIFVKLDIITVIVVFTIQELVLIINNSAYLWHSVICSGTHKQKKLGVK